MNRSNWAKIKTGDLTARDAKGAKARKSLKHGGTEEAEDREIYRELTRIKGKTTRDANARRKIGIRDFAWRLARHPNGSS
jgi:hypothetical protein